MNKAGMIPRTGKELVSFPFASSTSTPFILNIEPCNITFLSIITVINTIILLLPEKFLPFDWLRTEVFWLNLKYLYVKITVTMVTQNHQIISSHELGKNSGKISRF